MGFFRLLKGKKKVFNRFFVILFLIFIIQGSVDVLGVCDSTCYSQCVNICVGTLHYDNANCCSNQPSTGYGNCQGGTCGDYSCYSFTKMDTITTSEYGYAAGCDTCYCYDYGTATRYDCYQNNNIFKGTVGLTCSQTLTDIDYGSDGSGYSGFCTGCGFDWMGDGGQDNCCGDDGSEYYNYRKVGYAGDTGLSASTSDDACCSNSVNDCVYSGTCRYATYNFWNGDHQLTCVSGQWYDCDYSTYCSYCSGTTYTGDGGSNNCCGDDVGEAYVTQGVGTGACCSSDASNICVDASNNCRDEYSEETSCGDGIDNDCDGDVDYSDTDCCKSNGGSCSASSECCSGNCVDGYCCNNACGGTCQACDLSGSEGTCTNVPNNQDPDNECAASYTSCSNQYIRVGGDGYCDGAGACDTNDLSAYVTVGDVCKDGDSVDPSGNSDCGTGSQNCYCDNSWYQCDAVNDCTYDQYYVGFNGGSSCTSTGAVLRATDQNNPGSYRCSSASGTAYMSYTSIMDTNACSSVDHCSSGVYYTGKICSGGSCSSSYGPIDEDSLADACSCAGYDWNSLDEDGNPTAGFCCGDDGSENYISTTVASVTYSNCCDDSTDAVDDEYMCRDLDEKWTKESNQGCYHVYAANMINLDTTIFDTECETCTEGYQISDPTLDDEDHVYLNIICDDWEISTGAESANNVNCNAYDDVDPEDGILIEAHATDPSDHLGLCSNADVCICSDYTTTDDPCSGCANYCCEAAQKECGPAFLGESFHDGLAEKFKGTTGAGAGTFETPDYVCTRLCEDTTSYVGTATPCGAGELECSGLCYLEYDIDHCGDCNTSCDHDDEYCGDSGSGYECLPQWQWISSLGSETCCGDGVDNDNDGDIDGDDQDCKGGSGESCTSGYQCKTGYDCIDDDAVCGGSATCLAPAMAYQGRCSSANGETDTFDSYGIVVQNATGSWVTDDILASYRVSSPMYFDFCYDYGAQCDPGSLSGGYSAEGVCGGASYATCYTDHANDLTSSITASSVFGTESEVSALAYNGYYCDDVSDGSFSPGTYRVDGSDAACRLCYVDNTDEEGFCESGCGADQACDEQDADGIITGCSFGDDFLQDMCSSTCAASDSTICRDSSLSGCTADPFCDGESMGYIDIVGGNDICCGASCSEVDCDSYDDNDGSDGTMVESEVTSESCSDSCSGQDCCVVESEECGPSVNCLAFSSVISITLDEVDDKYCHNPTSHSDISSRIACTTFPDTCASPEVCVDSVCLNPNTTPEYCGGSGEDCRDTFGTYAYCDTGVCSGSDWLWTDAIIGLGDETLCLDSRDNNCDGESDLDSQDGRHGDDDCPVGIDDITVSDDMPCENSVLYVNCTSTHRSINSINAYVDLDSDGLYEPGEMCTFSEWDDASPIAKFNCSLGNSGSMRARCSIDTTKSYAISGKEEEISDLMDVGGNKPKIIAECPENNTVISDMWTGFPVVFNYTVTDVDDSSFDCRLIVDGVEEASESGVEKDVLHNFSKYLNNGIHNWSIECSDSGLCDNLNTTGNFSFTLNVGENVVIKNLGTVGLEDINENCTDKRAVLLYLTYNPTAVGCRYKNYVSGWSDWEECTTPRYWYLDSVVGLQSVYYQVNHSDKSITEANDTIEYDPSGSCLLISEPRLPVVVDMADYSNTRDTISAYWYGANDPDARIIGKDLTYEYCIFDDTINSLIVSWTDVGSDTSFIEDSLSLVEFHNYSVIVRVNNSEVLSSDNASSDGVFIDWTDPIIQSVSVSGTTSLNEDDWSNASAVSFEWITLSDDSGIAGYSMILDKQSDTLPDDILEANGLASMKVFNGIEDDEGYYFHIIAKDNAGNLMDTSMTYGPFGVDTVKPTIPVLDDCDIYAESNEITVFWEASYDSGSGVKGYYLNLTDLDTNISSYLWLGDVRSKTMTSVQGHNYHAEVIAEDYAGWKSNMPDVIDTEPPVITFKKPDGFVADYPILVLMTNEQCVCQYDLDGEWIDFVYTNSTYHETQYNSFASPVDVICKDMAGLAVMDELSFTDARAMNLIEMSVILRSSTVYKNRIAYFDVQLSPGIGELDEDDIFVAIDGESIYEFSLADQGNGLYSLGVEIDKIGSVLMDVSAIHNGNSVSSQEGFSVIDVTQVLRYTYPDASPLKYDNLVYSDGDMSSFGIAGESADVSSDFEGSSMIIVSAMDKESYLFGTRKESDLERKDKELKKERFDEVLDAFGYELEEEYNLKNILKYDGFDIIGEKQLDDGNYILVITNMGFDEEEDIVINVKAKTR